MSKTIFQTSVYELGDQVDAFYDEGMFVLFGENVPDTLKDFCHFIGAEFKISAVGEIAQSNLETLGHLTVVFSGAAEAGLPGSICVEAKPMPKLKVGSEIEIKED